MTTEELKQEAPEDELKKAKFDYMKKFGIIEEDGVSTVEWMLMLKLAVRRGTPLTDREITDFLYPDPRKDY